MPTAYIALGSNLGDREETMAQTNDPRMPSPDSCVVRAMLEKWVAVQPDKVFVKLSKTEQVTYAQMQATVSMGGTLASGASR